MQTVATRTLCDACLNFSMATASPITSTSLKPIGDYTAMTAEYSEAKYQCKSCDTIWLHRKNKWGTCEGFRLNPS